MIQQVLLVEEVKRRRKSTFTVTSLPGHRISLMLRGRVQQESSGRRYILAPGDSVWHYEDEQVSGKFLEAPWRYLTVRFFAPALGPPPFEARVKRAGDGVATAFEHLLAAWHDQSIGPALRQMNVLARLLDLLIVLRPQAAESYGMNPETQVWWNLESELRKDLSQPISRGLLERVSRRSMRTIVSACHQAVGLPPMRRIKQMRLSLARGLVQNSDLNFSEIAERIGYPRVQEFSRDYRQQFGLTPSADRKQQGLPARPE